MNYLCTMLEQLNYEIAGHRIIIHTPDMRRTAALLPTFYPFISFKFYTPSDDFLFSLTGNRVVDIPAAAVEDELEYEGRYSKVFRTAEGVFVEMKIDDLERRFHISPDWKTVYTDLSLIERKERFFLYRFMVTLYGIISSRFQTIKIHASVTEMDGKALIFLGKSGTGKSTHSRLWREFVPGCTLLNDDEPLLRVCDDGIVRVYGAPWSGSTPCYRNECAEVAAIVHLYQSPENKLRELSKIEALPSLFSSSVIFRSDPNNKETVLDTVAAILQRVPVCRLDCRPDREAVMLTKTLLDKR